ncbi:PREDICTED: eukaryotic translation initiation factor 4E-binding protein 1 [Tinamus guttatus]|nr:PREDICTED: eukaryotic translation initiation factor 4E-binding protein 1 [Tinamus guttatus]
MAAAARGHGEEDAEQKDAETDGSAAPPGGTRIIYDRKFLMECRNSPVAKTPPSDLPDIPGVTSPSVEESKTENNHVQNYEEKENIGEEEQFDMDI